MAESDSRSFNPGFTPEDPTIQQRLDSADPTLQRSGRVSALLWWVKELRLRTTELSQIANLASNTNSAETQQAISPTVAPVSATNIPQVKDSFEVSGYGLDARLSKAIEETRREIQQAQERDKNLEEVLSRLTNGEVTDSLNRILPEQSSWENVAAKAGQLQRELHEALAPLAEKRAQPDASSVNDSLLTSIRDLVALCDSQSIWRRQESPEVARRSARIAASLVGVEDLVQRSFIHAALEPGYLDFAVPEGWGMEEMGAEIDRLNEENEELRRLGKKMQDHSLDITTAQLVKRLGKKQQIISRRVIRLTKNKWLKPKPRGKKYFTMEEVLIIEANPREPYSKDKYNLLISGEESLL